VKLSVSQDIVKTVSK